MRFITRLIAGTLVTTLLLCQTALAQDIEPRRWTSMPLGTSVVGAGYIASSGDIFFEPVLRVENAEFEAHSVLVSYVRPFSLAGKSARVDALVPWANVEWQGLLDGQPATAKRVGLADPRVRLSVILAGPPALRPDELRQHLATRPVHTVVGAAVEITVPLGEYFDDKLLNLGQNRFIVRPQLGVVHTRGPWSYELTGSTFLFGDNDDFFGGSKLEQDPLFAVQGHVIRVFKPGLWASVGAAYGWSGEATLDGVERNDEKAKVLLGASFGFPIGRRQGVKLAYVRSETREDTGSDSDSFAIAWNIRY